VTNLTTLSERRQQAKDELARLQQFPAHILRMADADKDAAIASLRQEVEMLDQEIQQAAQTANADGIARVYGTHPVAEDAQADLKKAEAELEKVMAGAEATMRGYAAKCHVALAAKCQAANAAGQRVHLDSLVNAAAQRLANVVEQTVRHG
jgi:hypothetical protein